MATRTVRFEFCCDGAVGSLNFSHEMAENLFRPPSQVRNDAEYAQRFQRAVLPIMKEHEAACRAACDPACGICESPSVGILQTPMSWLHKEDPFVRVWVDSICEKGECEVRARRDVEDDMTAVGAEE
ncbi:hypothetical protein VDGL01_09918 [Verticillium dahliae]